ncbi:response regulator [Hymenobacter ruricola]|uniref:Response regulator n=1 Tax=Hymenobacter ruricola TaxID=2791023 RepID=A0ABS0HYZ4_9BACT|nr:response regulator [Hymenobacter ruricola]MBF9219927.1 response regulator [Hymenobacter ruricola]
MNPFFLRVLLAADSAQQAAAVEHYLHEAGHEVVRVEARADAALKAARLVHPDLVVLCGALPGDLDGGALAAALQQEALPPTPVVVVTDPAQLPGLLALQAPAWPAHSEASSLPQQDLDPGSAPEEGE